MILAIGQNKPTREGTQSLLDRVKRLSVALYRLTSYFEPNEPIRLGIRTKAIILMDTVTAIKDIKNPLDELLSYIDVLLYSSMLSETNAEILKDEILSLTSLSERLHAGEASPFFGLADLIPDLPPQVAPISQHSFRLDTGPKQPIADSQKDKRQSSIIDFIKKNGGANVRDLMAVVRGCSEKTIQRELALLIARGELKREGERRWSKYLLARSS